MEVTVIAFLLLADFRRSLPIRLG